METPFSQITSIGMPRRPGRMTAPKPIAEATLKAIRKRRERALATSRTRKNRAAAREVRRPGRSNQDRPHTRRSGSPSTAVLAPRAVVATTVLVHALDRIERLNRRPCRGGWSAPQRRSRCALRPLPRRSRGTVHGSIDEVGDGIVDLHAGFRILPVVLLDGRGESRVDCAFQIKLRADADAWRGEFKLGHDLSIVVLRRAPNVGYYVVPCNTIARRPFTSFT